MQKSAVPCTQLAPSAREALNLWLGPVGDGGGGARHAARHDRAAARSHLLGKRRNQVLESAVFLRVCKGAYGPDNR